VVIDLGPIAAAPIQLWRVIAHAKLLVVDQHIYARLAIRGPTIRHFLYEEIAWNPKYAPTAD